MQALIVENPGKESRLVIGEYETPTPGEDELLVRVEATALNRADLLQRSGKYPPPPGASPLLGLEMAGTVEQVGSACKGWRVGDRVCGLLPGGGYAQYVVLPQDMAMNIPESLSFEDAAAIPEVFLTAFQALNWLGQLKQGEKVLIHAGASGVGTAAIQLARLWGAEVFVTASAPKHALCYDLGASHAVDYKTEDFAVRVLELTGQEGVHLIVDFIGAGYLVQNIEALGLDGRLVLLALMGGAHVESFNLARLFRKRIHVKASTLRNRDTSYKIKLTSQFWGTMGPYFEDKTLKPIVDSLYDWKDANEAHERMASNKNAGKIVLRVS